MFPSADGKKEPLERVMLPAHNPTLFKIGPPELWTLLCFRPSPDLALKITLDPDDLKRNSIIPECHNTSVYDGSN